VPVADYLGVAWQAKLGGEVKSSAAVDAERVYVGSADGGIYALNRSNGEVVWRHLTGAAVEAPVTLAGALVLVGSTDGKVYAVHRDSGETIWVYNATDKVVGGVAVVPQGKKRLGVFGSYDGTVHAVDLSSGERVWTYETGSYIYGTPALSGSTLVLGGCDGQVHVLGTDGQPRRQVPVDAYVGASVAVDAGVGFVGHFDNAFMAFKLESGEKVWEWRGAAFPVLSSAALTPSQVIFGSRDRSVHGLDRSTGAEAWSFRTLGKVDASPVIVGDKLLVGSHDGRLYMLEHETGLLVWSFDAAQPITATVAVYDGRVYIGSHDGTVYAFERQPEPEVP